MTDIEEEIQQITARVVGWQKEIQLIQDSIINLKKTHQQALEQKDYQIKNIRQKLFACQEEREQIQRKFNDEILKVQNSPKLTPEAKYRATKLIVEKSNDFVETCERLTPITAQYRKLREDYIEQVQISRNAKQKTITNLWITIWAMLILLFIFHVWLFWLVIPKWIKKAAENQK